MPQTSNTNRASNIDAITQVFSSLYPKSIDKMYNHLEQPSIQEQHHQRNRAPKLSENKNNQNPSEKQLRTSLESLLKSQSEFIINSINGPIPGVPTDIKQSIMNLFDTLTRIIVNNQTEPAQLAWQVITKLTKIKMNNQFCISSHDYSKTDIIESQKVANQGMVIALPYEPEPKPIQLPASDSVQVKQNKTPEMKFYQEDDQQFESYIKKQFKTVRRENISYFAEEITNKICQQLIEELLHKKIDRLEGILNIIELLNQITPSIYTYYLLNIFNKLIENLSGLLSQENVIKLVTKQKVEKIIYGLYNIAERWSSTVIDNKQWEWTVKSHFILALLRSPVSQSKLTGVKMLIEVYKKSIYIVSKEMNQQRIRKFISQQNILQVIYNPDSHPEIINKGRQIYELLCQKQLLSEHELDILLNLLDKSHENVSKSLYIAIQNLGEKNLACYCNRIFDKIVQLPRTSCYCEETLCLIETLMIIAPLTHLQSNMANIYKIISKNYSKLKKHIREKLIKLYFEVFVMGIEEGILYKQKEVNDDDCQEDDAEMDMSFLNVIANSKSPEVIYVMMEAFLGVIKNQVGKSVYNKCRKFLNRTIYSLFTDYHIHQQIPDECNQSQIKYMNLFRLLLEAYESSRLPLSYEQICELIEKDSRFAKFIQFYNEDQQMKVFELLCSLIDQNIKKQSGVKNNISVDNVIELASLMAVTLRQQIKPRLMSLYLQASLSPFQFQKLSKYIHKIHQFSVQQLVSKIQQVKHSQHYLLSYLMLLKNLLSESDERGFSSYLPFRHMFNSYSIVLKITNSIDVFNPIQWSFQIMSYQTVIEGLSKVMKHFKIEKLSGVKIKINHDKYLGLNDFSSPFDQFIHNNSNESDAQKATKCVKLVLFESHESTWFDKCQLINSDNILHDNIVGVLKEIFTKYTVGGRMFRKNCAVIFQKATDTDEILESDSRIEYIFNYFSKNGQFLTIEQWLNFYQKSGEDNPGLVIDNLKKMGYAYLFKDQQLLEQYSTETDNSVREYLSKQGSVIFQYLFVTYQLQALNQLCISLVQQLPILPQIIVNSQSQQLTNYIIGKLASSNGKQNNRIIWYVVCLIWLVDGKNSSYSNKQDSNTNKLPNIDFQELLPSIFNTFDEYLSRSAQKGPQEIQVKILLYLSNMIKKQLNKLTVNIPNTLAIPNNSFDSLEYPIAVCEGKQQQCRTAYCQKFLSNVRKSGNLTSLVQSYVENANVIDNLLIIYLHSICIHPPTQSNLDFQIQCKYIFHSDPKIRQIINNFYYLISNFYPTIRQQYYDINITTASPSSNHDIEPGHEQVVYEIKYESNKTIRVKHCVEYFDIVNKLLQIESSEHQEKICMQVSANIQQSISNIVQPIENYLQSQENTQESLTEIGKIDTMKEDLLLGELSLLDSINIYHPELQISSPETWLPILLQQPYNNRIKQVLYRISNKLCTVEYNLELLKKMMNEVTLHKNSFKFRSHQDKMGLYNLGCTCYINSTIQQLFMIEPFRKGIIACRSIQNESESQNLISSSQHHYYSHYFPEFQKMIYHLAFSKREFFIPEKFCLTYTDHANQPINIKQQHDADQFLNSLFDRLETTLSKCSEINIIKNNFKGQMANILHCQSCYSHRIKLQDFYVLSLEIKNHKNLGECLQKITQPEIITDYYCEHCDKKVESIHKYHKLKQLPKYLFIHFQRLVFDLETLSKIKLEDKIQYENQIDLEDYMFTDDDQEGDQYANFNLIENASTQYQIRGFIVHVGTSESGHYYSLIKENNKWIKFDDNRLSYWSWSQSPAERHGAYMLIYEKLMPQIQLDSPHLEIGNLELYKSVTADNLQLVKQVNFLQKSFMDHLLQTLARIQIPQQFLESINSSPNKLQIPYHPEHKLLPTTTQQNLQQAHEIIFNFLRLITEVKNIGVTSSIYEYNENLVRNSVCYLIMIYHLCPKMAQKGLSAMFGDNNSSAYFRYMSVHSDKILRQSFKLIFIKLYSIMCSIVEASKIPNSYYLIPAPKNSQMKFIQNILQQSLTTLSDIGRNYNKMQQYFQFICVIIQVSEGSLEWLQLNNYGPKLIHFLLQDNSPLKNKLPTYSTCSFNNLPKKQNIINLITQIIVSILHNHYQSSKHQSENYELAELAYPCKKWIQFAFDSRCEYEHINRAIIILIMEQQRESGKLEQQTLWWYFCKQALEKINRFNHEDSYVLAYIHLIKQLLQYLAEKKPKNSQIMIEWLLGVPKINLLEEQDIVYSQSHKPSYRYYKYFSPIQQASDQIFLPLLELLFINRFNINYFTLVANATLLRLLITSSTIRQYVMKLPCPQPWLYEYYYEGINGILEKGLKDESIFAQIDKNTVLNEIAASINHLDRLIKGDGIRKLSNYSDEEKQKIERQDEIKIDQKREDKQIFNETNLLYHLKGKVTVWQAYEKIQLQPKIQLNLDILEDSDNNRLISYRFKPQEDEQIEKITGLRIGFAWSHYQYIFYIQSLISEEQFITPYPEELRSYYSIQTVHNKFPVELFLKYLTISGEVLYKQNIGEEYQEQKNKADGQAVITMGEYEENTQSNGSQQIIECPFCMNISYEFVSRCPNCGEEWGAFM